LSINGKKSPETFHRELGKIMWEYCGMARDAEGLEKATTLLAQLRKEFWSNVKVLGTENEYNPELAKAMRVADFIELGELMVQDALNRNESCGGHFREESQTDGEAKRDDENYAYVAAWEFNGVGKEAILNKEALTFENVKLVTRSYK